MDSHFFSDQLVGSEITDRLRDDIASCSMLRFLVAFISDAGINSLGASRLGQALSRNGSFGIASLSCIFGFKALLGLQNHISTPTSKLKYFLDPQVSQTHNDPSLVLLHSKLIYLQLENPKRSVVYIGSHNWTERAIGTSPPHNAEASIRLEMDFDPNYARGDGDSIAAQVNRHLLTAFNLPACIDAIESNQTIFEQWMQVCCGRSPHKKVEPTFIILAVLKDDFPDLARLEALSQNGIYLRTDDSGEALYNASHRRVILMLWLSSTDLINSEQPILIRCQRTSDNPDPLSSTIRSTNTSKSPSEGFGAAIYGGADIPIWSGRLVQVFDFEFQKGDTTAEQFDQGLEPATMRFHLDIEEIVFPIDMQNYPNLGETAQKFARWDRQSFAVAKRDSDLKYVSLAGYFVDPETEKEIAECYSDKFGISKDMAKVWPTSKTHDTTGGNFEVTHPLHETFLKPESLGSLSGIKPNQRMIIPNLEENAWNNRNFGEQTNEDAVEVGSFHLESTQRIERLPAINKLTEALVRRLDILFAQWRR